MILDGRELESGHELRCDVCIVGAGPAGIVIALELAKRGIDVILLESGGRKFDAASHDLNRGSINDLEGHGPLEDYRRRRLGGASSAWGGRSAPFDPIDFEPRDFVPYSGWPITRDELLPYYVRSNEYNECGAFDYNAPSSLPRREAFIPGLKPGDVTMDSIYRFSTPTNFGARYEADLERTGRIRLYLHVTATRLVSNEAKNHVERVDLITAFGRRCSVHAKRVVLAGGGLEATRLLLLSELGNENDLLGRFYMCHVTHRMELKLDRDLLWDYELTHDGVYAQRTLSVTEDAQRRRHILNLRARVEHPEIANPAHESGALSAVFLAKTMLTRQVANPLLADTVNVLNKGVAHADIGDPRAHLRNIARDLGGVAQLGQRWLTKRILSKRKLPSVVMRSRSHEYTLRIDAEQAPNPESRLSLAAERDANGDRRLHVDWRWLPLDADSIERGVRLFDESLRASGIGSASSAKPEKLFATGGHHCGTTRMSPDPKSGVVDPSCKLHAVSNVFVASSSVFPTCSYANPTLTIVALALRLADHLMTENRA